MTLPRMRVVLVLPTRAKEAQSTVCWNVERFGRIVIRLAAQTPPFKLFCGLPLEGLTRSMVFAATD